MASSSDVQVDLGNVRGPVVIEIPPAPMSRKYRKTYSIWEDGDWWRTENNSRRAWSSLRAAEDAIHLERCHLREHSVHDIAALVSRALACIEDPGSLSTAEKTELQEDLRAFCVPILDSNPTDDPAEAGEEAHVDEQHP